MTLNALTEDDSVTFHSYIHFLIHQFLFKHFVEECPQWSFTVHLVDSNIIKNEIKKCNARIGQLGDIEQRVSALEHNTLQMDNPQISHDSEGGNPRNAEMDLRNLLSRMQSLEDIQIYS